MTEAILWGAALRVAQAVILATPTILVGLAVAGVFRRLLGPVNTRRLFGCGTWRELPQAWLIGMLLPVCSLGVIPVAREMRRAGIKGGTIVAFAMTAPLFNPLSLLYGLTLAEPFVILAFAFSSLVVLTLVGAAFNRLLPDAAPADGVDCGGRRPRGGRAVAGLYVDRPGRGRRPEREPAAGEFGIDDGA